MSESNEERSPGFKRSLIGKLITVAIFVAIGTIGVAWFMQYCKDCDGESVVADAAINSEGAEENESPKLRLQPVSSDKPAVSMSTNEANQHSRTTGTAKPRSNQFSSTSGKPASNSIPSRDNSFGGGFNPASANRVTTKRPASNPPEPKSFGMPKTTKPGTITPPQQGNSFGAGNSSRIGNKSLELQKPGNTNLTDKLSNRFNQLKKQADEQAENVSNELNSADNALRNLSDQAGQVKQNLPGNGSDNSSAVPATFKPPGQETPPIVTRRSNPVRQFNPSNQLSERAINNSPDTAARALNQSTRLGNRDTGAGIVPVQLPRTNPVTGRNSSLGTPIQNRNTSEQVVSQVSAARLTKATPGDRKLEGMQSPSVTIEKIAPTEIQVNQPADFQLVVKNVGRITANAVRVVDQIPSGTELIQAVPQPSRGPGNQISWELDSLNPGQEKRIKIQLRPLEQGEIGSVAQVSFAAQASMRTKVTKPMLSVRHATEPRVLIGDPVVLDIDVRNEGDGAAADVIIQEDLPEGLEFSEGFRELEYAIGTLGPGQSKKVRLELRAAKIGKYRNVLVAHASGGLRTQHAIDLEVIAPRLVASGEGPTRRFLRREATHSFAVRNTGTAQATNVELICRLPNGLKYVSANNRGQYDENTHAVYWSLAELNSGLVANVEVTTIPTEPGNQDLKLEVTAELGQSTEAVCNLAVEHLIDVFFDIDDVVDPIEVGSDTAYKLRIENQGTKTATNVQLSIDFPPGIQPTAVEGNITSEIRGQQIAFSPITSMNPGDVIELTIRGKGVTPGDHRVSVNLIADGREVNVSKQESTRVYSDR